MIQRPRDLKSLQSLPGDELASNAPGNPNTYHLTGMFFELKRPDPTQSPSTMMRLLREQFDESAIGNTQARLRQSHGGKGDLKSSISSQAFGGGGNSLVSMKLRKELKTRDATSLLKSEISNSLKRVKAAKYGHRLEDIAPPYSDEFYLPDKTLYFTETAKLEERKQTRNATRAVASRNKNTSILNESTLNTSNDAYQYGDQTSMAFMTEAP